MDEFIILARSLITIGLTLLLRHAPARRREVRDGRVLRGDPRRRAAADPAPAGLVRPRLRASRSRILFIHPSPQRDLFLGSGDRLGAVLGGIAYGARRDRSSRSASRRTATTGSASRTPGRTRARCSTRPPPRSSTRSRSAARCSACCSSAGVDPTLANFIQAIVYTLTTRLGAPGPRPLPARPDARDRARRRLADGRRPAASRRPSSATPSRASRSSCAPATPARPSRAAARSRRSRSAADRPRAGGSSGRGSRRRGTADRRGVGPAPPVALYVHIPFCVSLCPYCDFVVFAGAAARGPRARVGGLPRRRSRAELDLRADALDAAFGAERPPLETRLPRRRDAVAPAGRRRSPRSSTRIRARFGHRRRRRGHARGQPGPGRARRRRRRFARPASPGCRSAPRRCRPTGAPAARPAAPGRRRGATPSPRRAAAGIGSVSLDLLYDVPDAIAGRLDRDARGGARARARPPLALRADPRRPRRRGPDRPERRPPADDRRARAAGARRPDPPRTRTAPRPQYHHAVHRLAADGWRGYEISNWARPGHESRHNLVYWERRPYEAVGPGRARVRRRDPALERGPPRRLPGGARRRRTASAPRLPPGGAETLDPATAAAEAVILGLRTDRGVPLAAAHEPPLGGRVRLGAGRRAARRHRRRPGRPDDPRPAALERAVRRLV